MKQPLTAALGEFIARTQPRALPERAVAVAKQGWTDCIGVMLAGAREPVTQAVMRVLWQESPEGTSSLFFGSLTASAPAAAWINGTAAHALDYDDVALKGSHPSAVLVPAILAEGQALGSSGADMVCAYVVGYETWAELISRERGNYQRKGWHPTGMFGAIGAAAACASLRKLSAVQAAHALGIAASEASGIMSNLGSMVKPMHAGKAASCGLLAARFAAEGMTSAADALEHEQGFLQALSPAGDVDLDGVPDLPPGRWRILEHGVAIKQYPVCYRAHRAIDAMLGLVRKHDIAPGDVRSIVVRFSRSHSIILKNHEPQTAIDAKFSIEFALACAVILRRVGLRDLTDDFVQRADVQQLMRVVVVDINPEEEKGTSGYSPYDTVRVELANGSVLDSEQVRHARGDAQAPLSAEELWTKFEDCAAESGLLPDARGLFDKLQMLEHCSSADLFHTNTVSRENGMGKLRHVAITVDNMEETASFYEKAFDLQRVRASDVAVMLSDGTVSLAIISSKNANAEGRKGLHHIGFLVDEMEAGVAKVEKSGGIYHGQVKNIGGGPQSERKYRDPNGMPFDVATPEHARKVWCIPVDEAKR